jgi:tetratricopeptide (TPR) repeat protein
MVDRAIAVAPDRPEPYGFKYRIYLGWHGPSPQSRQVLEEWPKTVPGLEGSWLRQEFEERNYAAVLERLARSPEGAISAEIRNWWECQCYVMMGEPERARETCEVAREQLEAALAARPNNEGILNRLGWTYALLGQRDKAVRAAGEQAVAVRPVSRDPVVDPFRIVNLASIYAWVGEHDEALDRIEDELSEPSGLTVALLRLQPDWDPLRNHPRFQEILEKYGDEQ